MRQVDCPGCSNRAEIESLEPAAATRCVVRRGSSRSRLDPFANLGSSLSGSTRCAPNHEERNLCSKIALEQLGEDVKLLALLPVALVSIWLFPLPETLSISASSKQLLLSGDLGPTICAIVYGKQIGIVY